MRAPIAYLARRTTTPPNIVPRLAPETYAGMVLDLPGRRGTVRVHDDGTGTVHDTAGRAVTTLPAHTVQLFAGRADEAAGTSAVREVVTAATK